MCPYKFNFIFGTFYWRYTSILILIQKFDFFCYYVLHLFITIDEILVSVKSMSAIKNASIASAEQRINYQLFEPYERSSNFCGKDDTIFEIVNEHCESLLQTYINKNNPQNHSNSFSL